MNISANLYIKAEIKSSRNVFLVFFTHKGKNKLVKPVIIFYNTNVFQNFVDVNADLGPVVVCM